MPGPTSLARATPDHRMPMRRRFARPHGVRRRKAAKSGSTTSNHRRPGREADNVKDRRSATASPRFRGRRGARGRGARGGGAGSGCGALAEGADADFLRDGSRARPYAAVGGDLDAALGQAQRPVRKSRADLDAALHRRAPFVLEEKGIEVCGTCASHFYADR